jgi:tripeptide aminopeptidase
MIKKDRLISRFMEYVQIDSESKNEKAIADRLTHDLENMGLEINIVDTRKITGSNTNNIYAFLQGDEKEEPILFAAHMDTVIPGNGIIPYIDGNYIKSDENTILGGDDKAGITAIIEAIKTIKENNLNHRPIEILFTVCEEIGLLGAKNFDYNLIRSQNAVVLDSSGAAGKIIIQAPCIYKMDVIITGKSSHAGTYPEKGVNAIIVASEAISSMKLLRIDKDTTANIGSIYAKGPTNIIPDKVEMKFEIRSLSEDKAKIQIEHMLECLNKSADKHGSSVKYNVSCSNRLFSIDKDNEFVKFIEDKNKKIGVTSNITFSTGGFDANILNNNGINTVVLSVGTENVHSTKERLNIVEFLKLSNLVLELMIV